MNSIKSHHLLRTVVTLIWLTISSYAISQPPSINYGEYKYSYSFDSRGNRVEQPSFPRIRPVIVTTNFGFVQSSASFMYLTVTGIWQNSPIYGWAGVQNGWYVYSNRLGVAYSYFLLSGDYETIRIQQSYRNGITDVYTRCDPNEMMNNAPTY